MGRKIMIDYDKLEKIHENTMRAVKNAGIVPNNSSFIYTSNKRFVKKGVPYHIHYTYDYKEYYMTGGEHSVTSRLIEPFDKENKSNFTLYANNYGKEYVDMYDVIIKPSPSDGDYVKGTMTRYFAFVRNDPTKAIVEVDEDFSTPLYQKFNLQWILIGNPKEIYLKNQKNVIRISKKYPNITKVLPNFLEYFIIPEKSEDNKIREKLGILGIKRDSNNNIVISNPNQIGNPINQTNQGAGATNTGTSNTSGGSSGGGGY